MQNNAPKRIFFYSVLLLAVAGILFFRPAVESFFLESKQRLADFRENLPNLIAPETRKRVSAPPPLKSQKEAPKAYLTQTGTIRWTNTNRQNNELPALKENSKLNEAALEKARDMFRNQYFEHVSPSGKGPADLAKDVSYEYITMGENLALGNFTNDEELLQDWMNSPGHRENILSSGFTEIGVAVLKGNFEGRDAWIAVQEFGTPISVCPEIDLILKQEIGSNSAQINQLAKTLNEKKSAIEELKKSDPSLKEKINEYNILVKEYNTLVAKNKNLIENYNAQALQFNDCVKSYY